MSVVLSPFQKRLMGDVIKQHALATTHTPFCCETAKRYQEQLGQARVLPESKGSVKTATTTERMATPGQIKLIWDMMVDRECTDVESREWSELLRTGQVAASEARRIIDTLKIRRFVGQGSRSVNRPNGAQMRYLKGLLAEREWNQDVDFETLTFHSISRLIDELKAAPHKESAKGIGASAEEGVYYRDGVYYKVQRAVHGSGKLYSKRFSPETQTWDRGGRLLLLTAEYKVTQEQAKQFGALYGRCVKCWTVLTDEESIERGYGPVCAEKMGF